jgi:predicted RNA-binding protein YlqC (UPF0109 family)
VSVEALATYMVKSVVANPDEVVVTVVEGTASVVLELRVHDDDVSLVRGDNDETIRAMQQILAVAGGPRKAILDLIASDAYGDDESDGEE